MSLIIGIHGRLGAGKTTLANCLQEKDKNSQIKALTFIDVDKIFNDILKLKDLAQIRELIENYCKQIEENQQDNLLICKQAFQDWVQLTKANDDDDCELNSIPQILYPFNSPLLFNFMLKRNYFVLFSIETPVVQRYENFQKKYPQFKDKVDLKLFCTVDDLLFQKTRQYLVQCHQKVVILNDETIENFKKNIFNNINEKLIGNISFRPDFDEYFIDIAFIVKMRSNCMKRAVGAVLTKNNKILSTGYNGTPKLMRNCYEGGCVRCNSNASQGQDLYKCVCIHAEANSIFEIGIHKSKGATLYTTLFPCVFCAKIIVQAKIERLVYAIEYDKNASIHILEGIQIEQVYPRYAYCGDRIDKKN